MRSPRVSVGPRRHHFRRKIKRRVGVVTGDTFAVVALESAVFMVAPSSAGSVTDMRYFLACRDDFSGATTADSVFKKRFTMGFVDRFRCLM